MATLRRDRALADGKDHGAALLERRDFGAGLLTRTLLGQHELAAGEVSPWRGKQDGDLQREDMLTVKVLVKTVEVAVTVTKQQRCRLGLARLVATRKEFCEVGRIADVVLERGVPTIGDFGQVRIERRAELLNEFRQRLSEVLILAASIAVLFHHDAFAEKKVRTIGVNQRLTLVGRHEPCDHRRAVGIQLGAECRPV